MDWLVFRALLLCVMFAVLAYQDLRTRTTDDRFLLVFGGAGAATYIADWDNFDMTHVGLVVVGSVMGGFLAWRFSLFGTGDILALISATIVFPLYENVPIMVPILIVAIVLAAAYIASVNISYNISDLVRGRLFTGIRDGPLRKTVAFFILHRQRSRPRHVLLAQEKKKDGMHLTLRQRNLDAKWASCSGIGKTYVSFPGPLMPFLLITMSVFLISVL